MHHLVGVAEIAARLGVSRQRVNQLAATYPDFPAPEADLSAGRIWRSEAIEAWMARHPERKPGRTEGRSILFERFTDRAQQIFTLAQDEARKRKHNYVGCEHLVIAMLREADGIAGQALRALELSLDRAREALDLCVPAGSAVPPDPRLPLTPRAVRAVELAEEISLEFGHNYVGTEHLLLGVLREGDNVGCRMLVDAGVDLAKLRFKVLELMRFPQPPDPDRRSAQDTTDADLLQSILERLERIEQLVTSRGQQ